MKKYFFLVLMLIIDTTIRACPACEKAQPRLFRGITHGSVPDSRWDYIIVCVAVIATLLTLVFSVKWLIRPGEADTSHIKHSILHHDTIG